MHNLPPRGFWPLLFLPLAVLLGASGCASTSALERESGRTMLRSSSPHERTSAVQRDPSAPEVMGPIQTRLVEVDYFQGLLARVGLRASDLPDDGSTLVPAQAARLLMLLAAADVKLRDWGPARMAAHLLTEVVEHGRPVTREELHQRMRRFRKLLVLRPDGYLVRATTGEAVQQVGDVWLTSEGSLKAEGLEVGPFYIPEGRWLFPVRDTLERNLDAPPAEPYVPVEGKALHAVLGMSDAVLDVVEGIVALVMKPGETLEGLARLPSAVRVLLEQSPQHWERYRALPPAEQVRQATRLVTGVVLTCGTAGAGGAKAVSVGSKLGRLGIPVLSLTGDGALALRVVAVPAGQVVTSVSGGVGAFYVLHMAGRATGGGSAPSRGPPAQPPGRWVKKTPTTKSKRALSYQEQVTGRPASEVYMVDDVEFDGFKDPVLLEAKGEGYGQFFLSDGEPTAWFENSSSFQELMEQARRQSRVAATRRLPLEWHVAESSATEALRKLFMNANLKNIQVIHTPLTTR